MSCVKSFLIEYWKFFEINPVIQDFWKIFMFLSSVTTFFLHNLANNLQRTPNHYDSLVLYRYQTLFSIYAYIEGPLNAKAAYKIPHNFIPQSAAVWKTLLEWRNQTFRRQIGTVYGNIKRQYSAVSTAIRKNGYFKATTWLETAVKWRRSG